MLQSFSVILLVLSIVTTIIPFTIYWRVSVSKFFFSFRRTKKEISGWVILLFKIILVVILGIIFVFICPNKITLYPFKCAIFSAILLLINVICSITIFREHEEKENCKDTFDFTMGIYTICLILVFLGNIVAAADERKDLPAVQEPINLEIINIEDDSVYYLDENNTTQCIELNGEVNVQFVASDQKGYVIKKCITPRYIEQSDKVETIYYKDSYYEYEIIIPTTIE